jgi:tetratricopeptide (TPR) repeat protein
LASIGILLGVLLLPGVAAVPPAAAASASAEETLKRAQALLADGRADEAVPAFESVVSADPKNAAGLRGLAKCYAALKDPRALVAFERGAAADPGNLPFRVEWVEYLWEVRRYERGNAEMEKIIHAAPGNPKLHAHYGMSLASQSRYAQASAEFDAARREGLDTGEVLFYLGSALWECGRLEESEKYLREAVQRDPEKAAVRHRLGRLLLFRGKTEEAVTELARAAQKAPDSAEIQLDYGRALEATQRMADAEAAYRKALALEPRLSVTHYTLGTLLARTGRREEAREHIALYQDYFQKEQQRRFEAGSRQAELNLGWTKLDAGRLDEALAQFARHPDDPEGLRGAAEVLSKLGRHAEAVGKLEHAVLLDPENRALRWELDRERERQ